MFEGIGILAGVISISGYVPYIRDVIRRTTYPERASWLIWDVLTAIAFFSQLAKGASASLWLPGLEMAGLTIVLLLSLKFGTEDFPKRIRILLLRQDVDLCCGILRKNRQSHSILL